MRRRRLFVGLVVGSVAFLLSCSRAEAQTAQDYGTLKGRIVWGGNKVPLRAELGVQADASFILQANLTADSLRFTILDESLLVNPANKGMKNVFLWLLPKKPGEALPALRRRLREIPPETIVMHTKAGMFRPRAVAMREGQTLVVKNGDPIAYTTHWIGDPQLNVGGIMVGPPGQELTIKDLRAQRLPLMVECNLHGWMKARVAVFDHPYYAVTDLNGDFEIRHAPVGDFGLMIYHEELGYRVGKQGEPIAIKPGVNNLGQLPMGK